MILDVSDTPRKDTFVTEYQPLGMSHSLSYRRKAKLKRVTHFQQLPVNVIPSAHVVQYNVVTTSDYIL